MALVTLVLLVMSVAMNSVDDSDSVEERSGWDPGWVEENPKEVSEENWESWPEWEEIEKEHPAMTGLKNDKVNYKEAGEDLVELHQRPEGDHRHHRPVCSICGRLRYDNFALVRSSHAICLQHCLWCQHCYEHHDGHHRGKR